MNWFVLLVSLAVELLLIIDLVDCFHIIDRSSKKSKSSVVMFDDMSNIELDKARDSIYWYKSVGSTMDTARKLISLNSDKNVFAVTTESQSKARGTRGRKWFCASHNLFLTVALKIKSLPISLQYLPLRCGTLISSALSSYITDGDIKLKWPNDILVDGKKLCGILIEMEGDYMLVGIGCNVMNAPEVEATGSDGGRPATSVRAHNPQLQEIWEQYTSELSEIDENPENEVPANQEEELFLFPDIREKDAHKRLAIDIVHEFQEWIEIRRDRNERVIEDFNLLMDYSPQRRRDLESEGEGRNVVIPIGLNMDGTLQVRYQHNNAIGALITEYLW